MSDYPPPPPGGTPPGSGGYPPPPPPPPGGGGGWGAAPPPPPGPGGYGYGQPYPGGPAPYSVGNAFGYAWQKFRENALPLVLITLVLVAAAGVVQWIGGAVSGALVSDPTYDPDTMTFSGGSGGFFGLATLLSVLFGALSFAVNLIIQSGIIKGALGLTRGQPLSVGTAFSGINWGQVVIAAVLIGVLTFVGILLCVIPGILVAIFTSYTLYFVIDRNQDAVTALKSSVAFVRANFGQLFLFWLASLAATIVGACACGVGLLVALPVVVIAQAYTFRMLSGDPVTA